MGPQRCANITHVTADSANFIAEAVVENCPKARVSVDHFHLVKVRHEVSCLRMGVRDLHRLVVAAAGLKLRAASDLRK